MRTEEKYEETSLPQLPFESVADVLMKDVTASHGEWSHRRGKFLLFRLIRRRILRRLFHKGNGGENGGGNGEPDCDLTPDDPDCVG